MSIENMNSAELTGIISAWSRKNSVPLRLKGSDIVSEFGEIEGCEVLVRSWDRHLRINTAEKTMMLSEGGETKNGLSWPEDRKGLENRLGRLFRTKEVER